MAEWTRDTPWRQGHLLGVDSIGALGLQHVGRTDATAVIVATHDCDLAQAAEGEPDVEVIVGRKIAGGDKDGMSTHAKNARKLHVEFGGAENAWFQFEAVCKRSVSKADLAAFLPRPDLRLSPESHAVFQMWLSSRYRRSAFPDVFERRLVRETKLAEKIAKAVKPHGDFIMGVFFDVDSGLELVREGDDDTYVLDVIVLHAADPEFETAEAAASDVVAVIEKAFREKLFDPTRRWQKIELRSCETVSESVLSYQAFKQLKRWRLDYISLAADPQQALLAE